jgi:NAD(P)-dependent dehydrogenase (short-subunit alcohol dehydrogenase family)/acyl carrier protein
LPTLSKVALKICHLWSVTVDDERDIFNNGFYSNLYLSRVLAAHSGVNKIQWLLVANNVHQIAIENMDAYNELQSGASTTADRLPCEKASLLALPLVLPQEHPHIYCRHIDIVIPSGSVNHQQRLTRQLMAELHCETRGEPAVVLRGQQRWTQVYQPLQCTKTNIKTKTSQIKTEGVYLITGGLGGIGMILAEHLATRYQAKLALVGRHPTEEKVRHLEDMGANFIIIAADCADSTQMAKAITDVEQRYGELNGIIHAAGLVGRDWLAPVVDTSREVCEPQWLPKIQGLNVLEKVVGDKALDFVLCMSSVSNVLGGLGHAAYIAGNLYMDAFVRLQNQYSATRWLSVNWDGWQTDSQVNRYVSNKANENQVASSQTVFSMTAKQGVKAFEHALAIEDVDVLVHSTGDLDARLAQWVKLSTLKNSTSKTYPRPALSTPMVGPQSKLDKVLCIIIQQRLGVDEIGIHDDFFELNTDSFMIVQLINMIKQQVAQDISVITLYKYPTVAKLSAFMAQIGVDVDDPCQSKIDAKVND